MPLTPFDVDKYRKAQPVITREGLSVTNLKEVYYPEIDETYLTAIIAGKPYIWDLTGARDYIDGVPDPYDLFMGETVVYKWAVEADLLDSDPDDAAYVPVIVYEPL